MRTRHPLRQSRSDGVSRLASTTIVALIFGGGACAPAPQSSPDFRARAEQVARDTATRAWRHETGVDSVQTRGDSAIVWVSPRNWMATDAPQAGVTVAPDGRIVAIRWIMGG